MRELLIAINVFYKEYLFAVLQLVLLVVIIYLEERR